MKRTRIKLSREEMISIVIGENNEFLFLDIIYKDDVKALDNHYMEEFGEQRVLPFVMTPEQFDMVIKVGMIPMMEMYLEQITGEKLDLTKIDKLKFNQDNSVN